MTITASAPGSIMVTGEHAVVQGAPAIVAAVDQRAFVEVSALEDAVVAVASDIADPVTVPLHDLPECGAYRFLFAAVKAVELETGVRITTRSDIDPTLGLGSSAAVTVAALGALARLNGMDIDIHRTALAIVRGIQGRGSGADLAASLHGGLLAYQLESDALSAAIEPLPAPPPMGLKYVGYKTPTADVLARVAAAAEEEPQYYGRLYEEMRICAEVGITAARAGKWEAFAETMNTYQGLMKALGVSDEALDKLVEEGLASAPGAKISGSGLGDCVLAFGGIPEGWETATLAKQGLQLHG
ncbi:MAG: mevalonate kinase [Pseudomonadota bacterium]